MGVVRSGGEDYWGSRLGGMALGNDARWDLLFSNKIERFSV